MTEFVIEGKRGKKPYSPLTKRASFDEAAAFVKKLEAFMPARKYRIIAYNESGWREVCYKTRRGEGRCGKGK